MRGRMALAALVVVGLGGCYDFGDLLGRHRPPFSPDPLDLGALDAPDLLSRDAVARLHMTTDLAVGVDLVAEVPDAALDLAALDDLARLPDLAARADLAVARDLGVHDLAAGPDLLVPPDLAPDHIDHLATGSNPADVRVGDVDGDKRDDLVVSLPGMNAVVSFLGQGQGQFKAVAQSGMPGSPGRMAPLADFDADGHLDVAALDTAHKCIYVAYGKGDGTFAAAKTYNVGRAPSSADSADLNGDKLPDLVLASSAGSAITILLGAPKRSFTVSQGTSAGKTPTEVLIADIDGNGTLDIACNDLGSGIGNSGFLFLSGKGDGTFASTKKLLGVPSSAIALADLDNDGLVELIYTDLAQVQIGVLRNRGAFAFDDPVNSNYTGTGPSGMVAADLDFDGKVDVAIDDILSSTVIVEAGAGTTTLQQMASFPGGPSPVTVRVGDFDQAGGLDLVTADSAAAGVTLILDPL